MWIDYFELMAVFLLAYFFVRGWVLRGEARLFERLEGPGRDSDLPGHPIDAAVLAHRLQEVRLNYVEERPKRPQAFKTSLLVEDRRAELEKSAFFQRAFHDETLAQEHGSSLLLA